MNNTQIDLVPGGDLLSAAHDTLLGALSPLETAIDHSTQSLHPQNPELPPSSPPAADATPPAAVSDGTAGQSGPASKVNTDAPTTTTTSAPSAASPNTKPPRTSVSPTPLDPRIERFIHLRSLGWSYARIAADLHTSKTTLITWSRLCQFHIDNLKAIELEALREKWLESLPARVDTIGARLRAAQAELDKRDLSTLTTIQLINLTRSLETQITQATGPVRFSEPVDMIPPDQLHEQTLDWNG